MRGGPTDGKPRLQNTLAKNGRGTVYAFRISVKPTPTTPGPGSLTNLSRSHSTSTRFGTKNVPVVIIWTVATADGVPCQGFTTVRKKGIINPRYLGSPFYFYFPFLTFFSFFFFQAPSMLRWRNRFNLFSTSIYQITRFLNHFSLEPSYLGPKFGILFVSFLAHFNQDVRTSWQLKNWKGGWTCGHIIQFIHTIYIVAIR